MAVAPSGRLLRMPRKTVAILDTDLQALKLRLHLLESEIRHQMGFLDLRLEKHDSRIQKAFNRINAIPVKSDPDPQFSDEHTKTEVKSSEDLTFDF